MFINDKFLNRLATIQLTENKRYKYLHHYVPKHILYIPVSVASFHEIRFRFTNQLNQTLMFSDSSSVIVFHMSYVIMPVARYPFSLTAHLKNGSQLLLDHAIHLNGEWEM